MNIENYDWNMLYSKVEEYLHNNNIQSATVCRNQKTVINGKAIVRVMIPQKGNKQEISWLKENKYFYKASGMNVDGKRIIQFGARASEIN